MELELEDKRSEDKRGAKFSDYLYILYKWRKLLIINLIIVSAITTVFAFMLPLKYKAVATVMIPPENSMGLGGLTGLLSNKSGASSLGSKILGMSNTSEDVLMGILNSRTALTKVIKKFDLINYYDITENNMDKAIKAFADDIGFSPNDYGMIEISVINKSPEKSAEIANYFVVLMDSLNIDLNIAQAKNNRTFIEKRYLKNVSDLRMAEDSLYRFQKKYGIFAVPEQLEVAVKAAGEMEAKMVEKEMAAFLLKQQYGEASPQYKGAELEYKMIKSRVSELKNSSKLSDVSNVLFPFKLAPDITVQYFRNFREIEIQSKIMEVVLPMFEQAKVEEQKSIPTIAVLDRAIPPQLKDSPKKGLIILTAFFLTFFVTVAFIYWCESAYRKNEYRNILEAKANNFVRRIRKIYRIKTQ